MPGKVFNSGSRSIQIHTKPRKTKPQTATTIVLLTPVNDYNCWGYSASFRFHWGPHRDTLHLNSYTACHCVGLLFFGLSKGDTIGPKMHTNSFGGSIAEQVWSKESELEIDFEQKPGCFVSGTSWFCMYSDEITTQEPYRIRAGKNDTHSWLSDNELYTCMTTIYNVMPSPEGRPRQVDYTAAPLAFLHQQGSTAQGTQRQGAPHLQNEPPVELALRGHMAKHWWESNVILSQPAIQTFWRKIGHTQYIISSHITTLYWRATKPQANGLVAKRCILIT